jgi:hypothetical protein
MLNNESNVDQIHIPLHYPTSLIYMDESGTAGNGRVFVVGALKVRRHGKLARAARAVRDTTGFADEFRFNRINRTTVHHFKALLETLREADTFFAATIVDRSMSDPLAGHSTRWEAHAEVASQLLRGCINRRELVSVSMDTISTPPTIALEDEIAYRVNRKLRNKSIITAALLDSKTCDCLQLVDVLTSAVACDYRQSVGLQRSVSAHKAAVVEHAKFVLGASAFIGRSERTNIRVWDAPSQKGPKPARVVPIKRKAG